MIVVFTLAVTLNGHEHLHIYIDIRYIDTASMFDIVIIP